MIFEITIPQRTAFFSQRVELDGVNYLLDFSYNQRADCFFLTVNDENGTYLLGPIKIVSNWPLLRWHRYQPGLPPGELWAISTLENIDVPGLATFGSDVGFYYYDSTEA